MRLLDWIQLRMPILFMRTYYLDTSSYRNFQIWRNHEFARSHELRLYILILLEIPIVCYFTFIATTLILFGNPYSLLLNILLSELRPWYFLEIPRFTYITFTFSSTYRWCTCSRYITYALESTLSFPEKTSWIFQRTRHWRRHFCIEIIFARDIIGCAKYNFQNEEKTSNSRKNGNCKRITFAGKTNPILKFNFIIRIIGGERIYGRAKCSTISTKSKSEESTFGCQVG